MNRRNKQRLQAEVSTFVRQYARKAPPHGEPNDRQYDRRLEDLVKRMDPLELDALLNGDFEEPGGEGPA